MDKIPIIKDIRLILNAQIIKNLHFCLYLTQYFSFIKGFALNGLKMTAIKNIAATLKSGR